MKRIRGKKLAAAVVVAAVAAALLVLGIVEGSVATVLVGVLVGVVLGAVYWNRRLGWAMRREFRASHQRLARQIGSLTRVTSRMDEVLAELERMETRIAQVDKGRESRTAAQFDWLARRHREQERALGEFLTMQQELLEKLSAVEDSRTESLAGVVEGAAIRQGRTLDEVLERLGSMDSTVRSAELLAQETSKVIEKADLEGQRRLVRQVRTTQLMFGTRKQLLGDVSGLLTVYADLPVRRPVLGDWSMTPRALERVRREVLRSRPTTIVEIGSGSSTPFLGYWAQSARAGATVLSVEHDAAYFARTRGDLEFLDVDNVEVVHVPLAERSVGDTTYEWYADVSVPGPVDLLLVDGPPQSTGKHARFPAVPLLAASLRLGSRVLLDDATRPDEEEIVRLWCSRPWHGRHLQLIEVVDTVAVLEVVAIDDDAMNEWEQSGE